MAYHCHLNFHTDCTQDLVHRFTLDSASQYLFGYDVQSLDAGLPHSDASAVPESAKFTEHPSNTFATAFEDAQHFTIDRLLKGNSASLSEPYGSPIPPLRAIINPYIDTIMERVLKEKRETTDEIKVSDDDTTLLDHLVDFMDGACLGYRQRWLIQRSTFNIDPVALRDQVFNMLVAGRTFSEALLALSVNLSQGIPPHRC